MPENIIIEEKNNVGIITLDRPEALNALSSSLVAEIAEAMEAMDKDSNIRCIILRGSERAFAAGADIKEMKDKNFIDLYSGRFIEAEWDRLLNIKKPIIASVSGYALGGGCELAMVCDMIIAADNAKFGQPEITLGVIPGAGGTQRLTRTIGKAKAMDMILTGRMMDAEEAEKMGLVARIFPADEINTESQKIAEKIAEMSQPIVKIAKQCVNQAMETGLRDGLLYERMNFYSCFATKDQKEGMEAFSEKRSSNFEDK